MGANAVVGDDRVMASTLIRRDFREALDAIDRARLTPLDVLLLIDLAQAESTVADLAERLNRRPVDVRRAIERLVARGLLRRRSRRSVARGLVFTATAAGQAVLRRVGLESTRVDSGDIDRRRRGPTAPVRRRAGGARRRSQSRRGARDGP
jgi:DNA-binding MarR family transcriptional regulator